MIKIGLIGCGFMGAMHANCYKNIEGVELVAVADVRREKAQELASGAEIFADGMDLIKNAEVDAIDICLPTYLHAEYALAAMDTVPSAETRLAVISRPNWNILFSMALGRPI